MPMPVSATETRTPCSCGAAVTRTVALQYAAKGIRANLVSPGLMDTPMVHAGLTLASDVDHRALLRAPSKPRQAVRDVQRHVQHQERLERAAGAEHHAHRVGRHHVLAALRSRRSALTLRERKVEAYAITDSAEFSGEWHLPGDDAPRVAGALSWREKRATLALHDAFKKMRGAIYGTEEFEYPAIHGTTTKSDLVSVLHAYRSASGFSLGAAGMREPETVTSNWVVIGAHVTADTKYRELRVRIPGLQMWISRSGMMQSILDKTDDKPPTVLYTIEAMPEEFTPIPTAGLSLGWGIDRQFSGDLLSTINVQSSACLRIKPDAAQTLEWLVREMGKAVTLLAFAAGSGGVRISVCEAVC